jgi:hypothetical protein
MKTQPDILTESDFSAHGSLLTAHCFHISSDLFTPTLPLSPQAGRGDTGQNFRQPVYLRFLPLTDIFSTNLIRLLIDLISGLKPI